MKKPWYDDVRSIAEKANSLEGLREVALARWAAYREKWEEMGEVFVVLKDVIIHFDEFGELGRITNLPSWVSFEDFPRVCRPGRFWRVFGKAKRKSSLTRDVNFWLSTTFDAAIPPPRSRCPVCKRGWTVDNLGDMVSERFWGYFDLGSSEGEGFLVVLEKYRLRYPSIQIHEMIDRKLGPDTYERIKLHDVAPICRGDRLTYDSWRFFHRGCVARREW